MCCVCTCSGQAPEMPQPPSLPPPPPRQPNSQPRFAHPFPNQPNAIKPHPAKPAGTMKTRRTNHGQSVSQLGSRAQLSRGPHPPRRPQVRISSNEARGQPPHRWFFTCKNACSFFSLFPASLSQREYSVSVSSSADLHSASNSFFRKSSLQLLAFD